MFIIIRLVHTVIFPLPPPSLFPPLRPTNWHYQQIMPAVAVDLSKHYQSRGVTWSFLHILSFLSQENIESRNLLCCIYCDPDYSIFAFLTQISYLYYTSYPSRVYTVSYKLLSAESKSCRLAGCQWPPSLKQHFLQKIFNGTRSLIYGILRVHTISTLSM